MKTNDKPIEQQEANTPANTKTDFKKLHLHVKQIEIQIQRLREMIKIYKMGYWV